MSTLLRQRMTQDLQLAGLADRTQDANLRAVRQLADHFHTPPDRLTEPQLRDYLLHLKNDRHFAASSLGIACAGIKFFYSHTVPRHWPTLRRLRVPGEQRLPDVLSLEEVRQLLAVVRMPHNRAYFQAVYSLGLRLEEGLHLQVGDIDSSRMMVHVHHGKGAKDRYVPLPSSTLRSLRDSWRTHRHPSRLFPATGRDHRAAATADRPMERSSVQEAMRRVVAELKLRKAISIHTLRHSYATHLLEAGVNLRLIQQYLGHSSLRTAMIYLHLTTASQEQARARIEELMGPSAMPSVAEVVRRYGPEYLERFGDRMPAAHKEVLRHIAGCRTGELGAVLYRCEDCGRMHAVGRSCGDRHCPSCQRDKAEAWPAKQVDRLLPCPDFLVTFTLPAELREVARSHQRAVYGALFRASSEAPRALMADPKFIGTPRPGFFGVLHTRGRALEYHPHVHYVVPGGGLSADGTKWLASRADFLVPVQALSIVFRAKFRDLLRDEGLLASVAPSAWDRDWVVHSRPAGDGRQSLRYLAPYVFRVAIGDHRIVSCDDGRVTFTYRKVGSSRRRKMERDAMEFLRRLLQHVLPSGLPKVRHYGFLSPAASVSPDLVRWLIALWAGVTYVLRSSRAEAAAPAGGPTCPACGGRLVRLGFLPAAAPAIFDTS